MSLSSDDNNALKSLVSAKDYKLICDIDARFPTRSIKDNFNKFAEAKPEDRLKLAYKDLKNTTREYCHQLNIPKDLWQSVYEHQCRMVKILRFMGGTNNTKKQAVTHDICEPVTSDFTPRDPITKEEKFELEQIAANIIFAKHPKIRKLWNEYEERETIDALNTKDSDLLELFDAILYVEELHPELHKDLDEVWYGPTVKDFTTDRGRDLLNDLMKDRDLLVAGKKPQSSLYKFMRG